MVYTALNHYTRISRWRIHIKGTWNVPLKDLVSNRERCSHFYLFIYFFSFQIVIVKLISTKIIHHYISDVIKYKCIILIEQTMCSNKVIYLLFIYSLFYVLIYFKKLCRKILKASGWNWIYGSLFMRHTQKTDLSHTFNFIFCNYELLWLCVSVY